MEILKFIFSGFWVFLGIIIFLALIFDGIIEIIKTFKK